MIVENCFRSMPASQAGSYRKSEKVLTVNQLKQYTLMKSLLFKQVVNPFCNRYIKFEEDYIAMQAKIDYLENERNEYRENIIRQLRQNELKNVAVQAMFEIINEVVNEFILRAYKQYQSLKVYCDQLTRKLFVTAFRFEHDSLVDEILHVVHQSVVERSEKREAQKSQKLRSFKKIARDFGAGVKSNQTQDTQLAQFMQMKQFQMINIASKALQKNELDESTMFDDITDAEKSPTVMSSVTVIFFFCYVVSLYISTQ